MFMQKDWNWNPQLKPKPPNDVILVLLAFYCNLAHYIYSVSGQLRFFSVFLDMADKNITNEKREGNKKNVLH